MGWYTSPAFLAALVPLMVFMLRRILQYCMERKKYPLPPGPTPLPFLGNVFSISTRLPWLTYTEWQKTYGDIIHVRLLNDDVIVLNSASIATELMEKRSGIYSDRPFISAVAAYGNDCNFALSQYGEHWRLCRRIFQQTFRSNAALGFRPMQLRKARQLICNIINDPSGYQSHFQTFAAAIAMSAVYDYEPSIRNDHMMSIIHSYLHVAIPGLAPGNILFLKFFPFLLHLPDWLPGSKIRRESEEARAWRDKVIDTPYQYVQKRMESGDGADTAMVFDHIVRMGRLSGSYRSEYEAALKHAAATAFLASAETTSSVLMTFTLAMVENPHVWKCAQASIDAIIGTDKLPDFDDRLSLPYIEAIVRETLRWRPVAPIIFHATTCSDMYEGYYIPEGAIIIANIWAISHDEARYPNPDKFIPERFLDEEGRLINDDPQDYIFGFGRRRCPGRHTADASVWSAIVTMLATLDFNLAKDANGNEILFKATFTNGPIDYPHYFPCRLTPRTHINREVLDRVLPD